MQPREVISSTTLSLGCVRLCNYYNFSVTLFPHLKNKDGYNRAHFIEL